MSSKVALVCAVLFATISCCGGQLPLFPSPIDMLMLPVKLEADMIEKELALLKTAAAFGGTLLSGLINGISSKFDAATANNTATPQQMLTSLQKAANDSIASIKNVTANAAANPEITKAEGDLNILITALQTLLTIILTALRGLSG